MLVELVAFNDPPQFNTPNQPIDHLEKDVLVLIYFRAQALMHIARQASEPSLRRPDLGRDPLPDRLGSDRIVIISVASFFRGKEGIEDDQSAHQACPFLTASRYHLTVFSIPVASGVNLRSVIILFSFETARHFDLAPT